jgi:hypothetical protein
VRPFTTVEVSAIIAIGGSVLAVGVPTFFRNLTASKLSEPIAGLDRIVRNTARLAAVHPHPISFPPSAPLTPGEVSRGVRVMDPPEIWNLDVAMG